METIKLDLIPGKKMPSLHASQYDDGRDYHIDLTENRAAYTLDGTETISLTVRKCDNTLVTMGVANVFGGKSYIEFRTTEQMNACAGFNYGEIVLEENGTRIGSLNFYLQVEEAPDEGGITSQSEINNLNRQITDEVDRILPDMVEDIAPAIVEEVAPAVVREVAPAIVEDVAPPILERLAPSAVEEVAPSIVERLVPAEVAVVAPSVVREVAAPIVEELVPIAVGDNYYNKTQTDAKIDNLCPTKNTSGSIASFITSLSKPLISLRAIIDYKVGGVGKINVARSGKNLFPIDININDSTYIHSYTKASYPELLKLVEVLKNAVGKTIILSANITGTQSGVTVGQLRFMQGGTTLATLNPNEPFVVPSINFTSFSGIVIYGSTNGATIKNYQIEFGSVTTSFRPYSPIVAKAIDISGLGSTVYGGYFELTPTTAKVISTKNSDGTDKATPEVFDLSGITDFDTLLGENNILAGCGNITECVYLVEPSVAAAPLQYKVGSDYIEILKGYGDKNLLIALTNHGGNNLFDYFAFYTVSKLLNIEQITQQDKTLLTGGDTDWHAPFQVRAVNNIDGDNFDGGGEYNVYFTGGNHQYNNTGVGSTPTARQISLKFFANDNEVFEGDYGFANNVKIEWVNRVQGYNTTKSDGTGREIIEEKHTLVIDGERFNEHAQITALEDVIFKRYYGLQFVRNDIKYPNIRYVGAVNRGVYSGNIDSNSGNKVTNGVFAFGTNDKIMLEIDTKYDLGKRELCDNNTNGFFTTTSKKSYGYLISEETAISENESLYFKGCYQFEPN